MEPGTGKTLTVLYVIARKFQQGKINNVLIIGPKVSQLVWEAEIARHLAVPARFHAVEGNVSGGVGAVTFSFINPERVWRRQSTIFSRDWDAVVVDESHCLKSRSSKQSRFIATIPSRYRYILTGTPQDKDMVELWAQWRFCKPDLFGTNWKKFVDRWCVETPVRGPGGRPIPFVYKTKIRESLHRSFVRKMKPWTYEAKKRDLPPLSEIDHPVDLPPRIREPYDELEQEFIAYLKEEDLTVYAPNPLSQLIRLQQLTTGIVSDDGVPQSVDTTKIDAVLNLIALHGTPAVVFSRFIADLDRVAAAAVGKKISWLTGRRKDNPRGDWDLMLAQVKAGGVSVDLSRACHAYFITPTLSWTEHFQAMCRLHRSNQTRPVSVWRIFAVKTVDEKISKMIKEKRLSTDNLLKLLRR